MDIPLKVLFWYYQHPTAYKAYFYLYWIYEPVTDLLTLFIGYRLICHLCDSAALQRFALWLFSLITFLTITAVLLFLSSPFGPHITIKARHVFITECCLHVALCAMVLVLVIYRKSLGGAAERPMMLIALGLGIMAASSLISSASIVFAPRVYQAGNFAVLGCIEAIGALSGLIMWCFAALRLQPAADASAWPNFAQSLSRLDTESNFLIEIMKR
jgi:hypothetical protein